MPLILALMLASPAYPQPAIAPAAEELTQLLKEFLEGASRTTSPRTTASGQTTLSTPAPPACGWARLRSSRMRVPTHRDCC